MKLTGHLERLSKEPWTRKVYESEVTGRGDIGIEESKGVHCKDT